MRIGIVDIQIAGLVDAGGDQHRIMLAANGIKAEVFAHIAVQHEFHAAVFQQRVAALNHVLFQLEAGDAVDHQPAGTVVAVVNGDLKTHAAQAVGGGQTAGASPDDADGFGTLNRRADAFDPAFFPGGVGDVFFNRADGDGAVARLFDHAIALAQAVLRADAAADFREGVGLLADQIGLARAALGGQAQPVGDVVVQGAMRLAIGHAALAATAGLLGGLHLGEFAVDLVEILAPLLGRAFFGHLPPERDEFQHFLRGHIAAPPYSASPSKPGQM